jgi:hypothetical protein
MACETRVGWRTAASCAVVLVGCWQSYQESADGGATIDADVIHDGDGEADLGADVDVGGTGACDGTWLDPTTGYLWQNPPPDSWAYWRDALAYCNGLTLCEYPPGSWHLPTIDELRTLVRGCLGTMTGGACGVADSCLDTSCGSDPTCAGCDFMDGPGFEGCYWGGSVLGGCYWEWSSSHVDGASAAWGVCFHSGYVSYDDDDHTHGHYVRCVHTGP